MVWGAPLGGCRFGSLQTAFSCDQVAVVESWFALGVGRGPSNFAFPAHVGKDRPGTGRSLRFSHFKYQWNSRADGLAAATNI